MEGTFPNTTIKKWKHPKVRIIARSRQSTMTPPFDLTDILAAITRHQTVNRCSTCQKPYHKTWCPMDHAACFFCKTYAPHPYVYSAILKDAEWYSLKQGITDSTAEEATNFYKGYLEAAQQWCEVYGIPSTRDDKIREQELLQH